MGFSRNGNPPIHDYSVITFAAKQATASLSFSFPVTSLENQGGSDAPPLKSTEGCKMLNENTLDKLTEMMEIMANRVIRGNMGVAADMLCWTPLAPWIRASRRARIQSQTHESRLREKASALCKDATREHADLLASSWV